MRLSTAQGKQPQTIIPGQVWFVMPFLLFQSLLQCALHRCIWDFALKKKTYPWMQMCLLSSDKKPVICTLICAFKQLLLSTTTLSYAIDTFVIKNPWISRIYMELAQPSTLNHGMSILLCKRSLDTFLLSNNSIKKEKAKDILCIIYMLMEFKKLQLIHQC